VYTVAPKLGRGAGGEGKGLMCKPNMLPIRQNLNIKSKIRFPHIKYLLIKPCDN